MANLPQYIAASDLTGTYEGVLQFQVFDLVSSIDALLKRSDDAKPSEPQLRNIADDTSSTEDPSSCSGGQEKGAEISEPELEVEPEGIEQSETQPPPDTAEKKPKSKRSRKRLSLIDLAERQRQQPQQQDLCGLGTQPVEFGNPHEFGTQTYFCVWCGASCVNCKFCIYCGSQASIHVALKT